MHQNFVTKNDTSGFEEWGGYMEAKKRKLEEQFHDERKAGNILKKNIFNGVSIFVNGYTVPTANELRILMMEYGGVYHNYYYTNKTTFTVATNLPASKMKQLKNIKVIKPDWILDSISNGKMLDYRPYLLYTDNRGDYFKNAFAQNSILPDNDEKLLEPTSDKTATVNEQSEDALETPLFTDEDDSNSCSDVNNVQMARYDKNRTAKTASDDNFLNEFYNNSRLHHLSTMSTTFKDYVTSLRATGKKVFEGRDRFKSWISTTRIVSTDEEIFDQNFAVIMHIDMDCFFASVGVRNRPHLKGKPVVVTHARGNKTLSKRDGADRKLEFNLYSTEWNNRDRLKHKSHEALQITDDESEFHSRKPKWFHGIGEQDSMSEIACCNYEARKFGIKNGMLLGQAFKLCPNLQTIPYDFDSYKEVSYALYNHIIGFTLDIESVSCDEMYVNCTEILKYAAATPMQFATFLRTEIKEITGCPCSTGFGSNVLLARLATKKAKPDGQFHIEQSNVKDFMANFNVSDLPGVGHSTVSKLSLMGINTCQDLQNASLNSLQLEFGNKFGLTLYKHAFGEDDRKLNFDHQRKSVSADVNYGIRFQNDAECEQFLKKLSDEVGNRLDNAGLKGKCITLKLMIKAKDAPVESAKFMGHGLCNYFTKSTSVTAPTSDPAIIFKEILKIVRNNAVDARNMRGIGIQVTKLEKSFGVSKKLTGLDKFLKNNKPIKIDQELKNEFLHIECGNAAQKSSNEMSGTNSKKNINYYFKTAADNIVSEDSSKGSTVKSRTVDKNVITNVPRKTINSHCVSSSRSEISPLYNNLTWSQIDQSVLEALPDDIKSELIDNFSNDSVDCNSVFVHSKQSANNTSPIIDDYPSEYIVIDGDNVRLKPSISSSEIKVAVSEWIKQAGEPQLCDIYMITNYLQCKIYERNLEPVDVLFRLMHRLISKTDSTVWKNTYCEIVNHIQQTMKSVYGKPLLINDIF